MVAKEIMSKKFEMVLRGYKAEEVEEFMKEISIDFSRLQKENEDLEKKLEVLADKIREYREDEDALKDALLGAQRQGNALIADSKRKAAVIIEEAQKNADDIIKKAEDDRKTLKEKGEKEKAEAKEKAAEIIENANVKAKDIEDEMNLKTDVQREILYRTTNEIEEFKQRILNSYKKHMDEIDRVFAECENDFIRETAQEYQKAEGSPFLKNSKKHKPKDGAVSNKRDEKFFAEPVETKIEAEADKPDVPKAKEEPAIKFEIDVDDEYSEDEIDVEAIFGKGDYDDSDDENSEDGVEEVPLFKESKTVAAKTSEIFFKKSRGSSSKSKQLRFGNNSEDD